MKKLIFIFVLVIAGISVYPQNMRDNASVSLFSDQKASRVGDAITILVVEASSASNNAEKSTSRKSDLGFNGSGAFGGTGAGSSVAITAGTSNGFAGNGATKTSGMVSTKISATIDSVLNNGNMQIRGSRKIVINGEEQLMSIKGIVRPSDIMADNSVMSYNISEAEIVMQGKGLIDDAQSPGWLTKFLHWIF